MAVSVFGLGSANFATTDPLATSKAIHRYREHYSQATGTAVVALTNQIMCVAKGTGTIKTFQAAIIGAIATGADRTVTIDLQKSTALGAFATVLSSTIVFNNASTLRVVSSGSFSDTTLANGDFLYITVAVAGAAGNQAQGLAICLEWDENP